MDGSSDYVYDNIIKKLYYLFIEQNQIHSDQKYKYWKCIQKCKLPNIKDETWKYLPLNKLFSHKFSNSCSSNMNINESDYNFLKLNFKSYQLVFINGFFSKKLSSQNFGPWIVQIINRNTYQKLPKPIQPEFFLYLTECLSYETIYISLPNNIKSDFPLYLLHINQGTSNENTLTTFHYRHHIEIHNNSSGQIIEHYTSINKNSYFNSSRMSIIMGSNTKIEHTKLSFESRNSYHISHNDIHANYNSIIQSNIFNIFSSHLFKHQTSVLLNNKSSSISLNSLLLPIEQDINDISTYVKHNKPGFNSSKQIHKIIVSNQGYGIFRGLIHVNKKTKNIDGKMFNKNLLLNQTSKIYSTPKLEIYSDDVICTHGSTIGYINHEEIFYLCTRGISYQTAYQMIIYGFALEIIEKINNDYIQKKISTYVINTLTRIFYNGISDKKNQI